MRAGALDRAIEIWSKVTLQNTAGELTETWQRTASEWAKVESELRPEMFVGDRTLSYKTKYFTIRYYAGLSPDTHRIRFEDEDYDILAIGEVENRGRRIWLRVLGQVRS